MNKTPLEDILVKNNKYGSAVLKHRLIEELYWEYKCLWCGIGPEWNGKPLTLQLDHINGDHYDNRIENLRILCPNCHTQTKTWGMNNTKFRHFNKKKEKFDDVIEIPNWFFKEITSKYKYKEFKCDICKIGKTSRKSRRKNFDGYVCFNCNIKHKRTKPLPKKRIKKKEKFDDVITIPEWFFREPTSKEKHICDICKINTTWKKSKSFDGYRCKECCLLQSRKVKNRPSKEELIKLVEQFSYVHVGRMFGVSDNSIRKWIK